ncbi:histidine kinase [Kordia sp.]|uniref:sensor histidine kinase n=1 Tax=Kordia sp. TaxID=1965332 RepID=UPI0025BBF888|nr:histidine kinase [Kordia sp.]MCH2196990.1 histidine kinase [Kordia sp.]
MKNIFGIPYILILLFFSFSEVAAQQPMFMQLTEKEDLPDKEFYNVLEDDHGFIWLAADKGLYRYDGKEFKLFSHPDQVGLSVFSLQKDQDNSIWFTNLANQVFYVKEDKIELFLNLKKYFSGSLPRIYLHKNLLILCTIRSMIIVDKETKEILFEKKSVEYLFNSNGFIHEDAICFLDDKGNLVSIDQNFEFKQRATKLNFKSIKRTIVYIDKISGMYVVLKKHLNGPDEYILFEMNAENVVKIHATTLIDSELVHKIRVIGNELFVASAYGVYVYGFDKGKFVEKERLLQSKSVSDVLKDSNGNLWFTTLFEGIYVVPNLKLNVDFQVPYGNTIRKLFKGKSNELFLVGKQKEFYVFNHDTNAIQVFPKNDVADIKYIFYDNQKSLYYLQTTKALEEATIQNNKFNFFEKYYPGVVKDHTIINKDSVLLAVGSNIILTTMRNGSDNKIKRLYSERVRSYCCYYSQQKRYSYFATVKGLFAFDEDFSKSEILFNNKSIFIKAIVASDDGTLWCLSFKNGLYQIKNNQIIKNITVQDGLLSNLNSFLQYDTHNNLLWIAGEKGLQQFNINTEIFQNLTKKQGIPSYEFTGLEMIDEKVYVSTADKLFSFNSKTIFSEDNTQKLLPYFSAVRINDKNEEIRTQYKIPYNNEKVEIAFNTNGFLSNETITYEYRLLAGTTKNTLWQDETSGSNKVVYNKLSEGNYTFQLRAKNGIQKSEIIALQFQVAGVFYQQWWFYLLGTFAISFFVWYYFHQKNRRFQEKQQLVLDKQSKELENVFLKLESLRSQMNPHFIFNALNSIQDYIIRNEKKLARTYLVKFSRLIRMYLEHSQQDTISLEEELRALNLYLQLEKDRFEDSFKYEILVDKKIETEAEWMPTFLLQPYVENAIKHGLLHKKTDRKLDVTITKDDKDDSLICIIDDNGVGREASNIINNKKPLYPKSFSSDANEKRIELLNKTRKRPIILVITDKKDAENNALGTRVTVSIPLAE